MKIHHEVPVFHLYNLDRLNLFNIYPKASRPVPYANEELRKQNRYSSTDVGEWINVFGWLPQMLPSTTCFHIKHSFPPAGNPVRPSIKSYQVYTETFFPLKNTDEYNLARWFYEANISWNVKNKYPKLSLGSHISPNKETCVTLAYLLKKLVDSMEDTLVPHTSPEV